MKTYITVGLFHVPDDLHAKVHGLSQSAARYQPSTSRPLPYSKPEGCAKKAKDVDVVARWLSKSFCADWQLHKV